MKKNIWFQTRAAMRYYSTKKRMKKTVDLGKAVDGSAGVHDLNPAGSSGFSDHSISRFVSHPNYKITIGPYKKATGVNRKNKDRIECFQV